MDLLVLTQHIEELVASTDTLKDQFGDEWLFVGVAGSFPAITIDGISCVDDKQGKYLFNLNLILRSADDTTDDISVNAVRTFLPNSTKDAALFWAYDCTLASVCARVSPRPKPLLNAPAS